MAAYPEHSNVLDDDPDESRFSPILAHNVKRLRVRAKINKKTFALMVGIGRPFLNKIENGTANPKLDVITKMADALETTPNYLLTIHTDEELRLAAVHSEESKHARLL